MDDRLRTLLMLSLAAALPSTAQNRANAPAQTIPTLPEPETSAQPGEGLLMPETGLPNGFSFRADQLELVEGDSIKLAASGNILLRTNRGDVLRSQKAFLDYSEEANSAATFSGHVRLRSDNGIEIFADRAHLDEERKSIVFSGNVSAYQGTALHRGEEVIYQYERKELNTRNLRTSFAPLLLEAGQFQAQEREEGNFYQGRNAGVTTHDAEKPNYWMRGDEVTVIPGESVHFRNLRFYAADRQVFWLPGLTQDFDGEFNYRPTPGIRSNWGPYLLNQYSHDFGGLEDPATGLKNDPTHEATWHFDLYGQRGVGLGLDLDSYARKDNPNLGWISGYHIYDLDPGEQRSSESRDGFDDPNRYYLQARQRIDANWLPGAEGFIDLNSTLLSDRFFMEDFRPRDYTTDYQPDNTLIFSQAWEESQLLTAWTRFRLNEHYQSDLRLPEVVLDQVRRPILGSALLHESQNMVGLYREELADFREERLRREFAQPATTAARRRQIEGILADTGFARFHTYHEISYPLTLDSGLHLTPRLGAGHTRYHDVQGPLDSESRTHLHLSVDASLKFTRQYPDWISQKWGLDSALHVFQPYATATSLTTDNLDASLRPIDRLTPSTRPRALHLGRFSAIDDFADWQILRLGTRNRILTRRNGSSHQWLEVDSYIDIFGNDPEFDRAVSNFYTDVHWSPLPWLDLTLETQIPLFSSSNFTEIATGVDFMLDENTELSLNHRFLHDHPILRDSNRLEFNAYHRFNEEWGLGATQRWEFEDSTLEFQEYSLHRNLDSWIFTMGLFSRDNSGETEYGLLFGLTLTDFPTVSLPLQVDN
ncbi:LPS-assembly protein LptD [Roseibacillus ishigakijimensis]|uniref:LPS-assembly protein LptD n=1 Tax=Roseibacillus ishigakijimensis TaxID=454146 RepID=A0A934VN29_9BACT|nr:LPS-assembly protein LptD [Roseibacillus ishigakijimensis]MBK1834590.1 LPS-assembly protein LptD [Roseibacillus ishigakijimensis]